MSENIYIDLTFDISADWSVHGTNLSNFVPPTEISSSVTLETTLFNHTMGEVTSSAWTLSTQVWDDKHLTQSVNTSFLLSPGVTYLIETLGDYHGFNAVGYGILDPEVDTRAELWTYSDIRLTNFAIRAVPEPTTLFLLIPGVVALWAMRRRRV
jgi:hypothetical protein